MTSLYLVRLDTERRDRRGEPLLTGLVGVVAQKPGGYRFIPQVCGHTTSRKLWPDAVSCIPRWAQNCGFTRLYDKAELDAAFAARA